MIECVTVCVTECAMICQIRRRSADGDGRSVEAGTVPRGDCDLAGGDRNLACTRRSESTRVVSRTTPLTVWWRILWWSIGLEETVKATTT